MSWLRTKMDKTATTGNVPDAATCDHEALSPRWRDAAALGESGRPIGYVCHHCHAEFLPYAVRDGRLIEPR
jgi:hypothetical protein